MRTRIKFAKYDTMRFIGHLDVMRYFQRMIRRSNLPVSYSEGYHPHQLLSFAQPLGLGITSDGEYVDTEFDEELDCDFIKEELSKAATHGYAIMEVTRLHDRENNRRLVTSMSLINRSVYEIILKDFEEECDYKAVYEQFLGLFKEWILQDVITVIKKSKKSEREINLKESIYEFFDYTGSRLSPVFKADFCNSVITDELAVKATVHAPEFDNDIKFIASLSAGSEMNIAPDFFMDSFLNFYNERADVKLDVTNFRIHRMELLGSDIKESVPLSCLKQ